jgi:hypothetical protein
LKAVLCTIFQVSDPAEATVIQRTLGVLVILLGLSCAGLLGYQTFVDIPPRAHEYSIYPPIITSLVLIALGVWLLWTRIWLSWDKVFRPFFGVCGVVFGVAIIGLAVYSLFGNRWDELEAVLLAPRLGLGALMIAGGVGWLRRKAPMTPKPDETGSPSEIEHQKDIPILVLFQCPSCQQSLQATWEKAGTDRRCPRCGAVVTIPQPQNVAVPWALPDELIVVASPAPGPAVVGNQKSPGEVNYNFEEAARCDRAWYRVQKGIALVWFATNLGLLAWGLDLFLGVVDAPPLYFGPLVAFALLIVAFGLFILGLFFCTAAPPQSKGKGFALAAAICAVTIVGLPFAHLLWLSFLRRVARYFEDPELAVALWRYLLFAGWSEGIALHLLNRFSADLMAGIEDGYAAPMYLPFLVVVQLVLLLVFSIWYLYLLFKVWRLIRDHLGFNQ